MIPALGLFTQLYAALLALWAIGCALLRRPPGPAHLAGVVLLELMLALRAAWEGWSLVGGRSVPVPAVHVGYLAASVLLLPLLTVLTRTPERPRGGGDSLVLALGCAAIVVVAGRLGVTGRPSGAG